MNKIKILLSKILVAFLILLSTCLVSFAQDNQVVAKIPFEIKSDNRIYTWCKINKSDSLLFLVDTGASDVVINTHSLDMVDIKFNRKVTNLGSTGTSRIKKSDNNSFIWGGIDHRDVSIISIPYPNEVWDGVLGLSILSKYVVEINYDYKQIILYDKDSYSSNSPNKSKMEFKHKVPYIQVCIEIKDEKYYPSLEIDTGSDRIIDLSTTFTKKHSLSKVFDSPYAISTITSSDGSSGKVSNVYFDKLDFAGIEMYKIAGGWSEVEFGMLSLEDCDGIIGNNFLKRFNLIFDFNANYLYCEPNNYLYTPFYDFLVQ